MQRAWVAAVVALALAALLPASAAAATSWRAMARELAAPWPGLQLDSGELPDYLDGIPAQGGKGGGTRYGDAFMGYALIQTGLREGNRTYIRSGLRAINFATSGARAWPTVSVFEAMAVASAYNLARKRIPREPLFRTKRRQWAEWMRDFKTVHLQWETHFGNHWLVDAIAVLELQRSGVRSRRRGAVLGGGRRHATRRARRLVNSYIPNWATSRRRAFVLSDPRDFPLAYQGLSVGLYARAVTLLGRRAHPRARRALRQMMRASALMAAPNGDGGYFGRSQEQLWALTGTAYAAELAARLPGSGRRDDRLAHAVSSRSMARLDAAYPMGRYGTWITPGIAQSLDLGARGADEYAGAPSMAGIALVLLNWTLDLGGRQPALGRLPADRPGFRAGVSQERGRFAVVRRARTWFAVKKMRTIDRLHWGDLRYDAGIVMALRRRGGRWTELIPQRPFTKGSTPQSAGPILMRRPRGWFQGDEMTVGRSGRVRIRGHYQYGGRGRGDGRRATLVYRPTACGVVMGFDARRGETFRLSAFFLDRPGVSGRVARDANQRVAVKGGRVRMRVARRTWSSGTQARLYRVVITVRAARARNVLVRFFAA